MLTQNEIIGQHPPSSHELNKWFTCNDGIPQADKCHRALTGQVPSNDEELTDWLAQKIITHHYSPEKLIRLKQKYTDIGFPKYAKQHRQIPITDKTRKGNATEIILIEYIKSCQASRNLFHSYKFRYNSNVDQSMKGDDALLIDLIKDEHDKDTIKVFLGESKFRGTPDKTVLKQLSSSLGKDKLPISFTFLIDRLYEDSDTENIAILLEKFIMTEVKAKGNLKYAGLLLSNSKTSTYVDSHFQSDNPSLILISASIDQPEELISKAFRKAEVLLNNPIKL